MEYTVAPLERLAECFAKLPGIGHKGAARYAYYVQHMSEKDAMEFAQAIQDVHTRIHRCSVCQNITEDAICSICADERRDKSIICVVGTPRDVTSFESTNMYHGVYHVLHGLISPVDGVGVDQLCIKELIERVRAGGVREVIMATSPTIEGDTTSSYIAKQIKPLGVKVTRIAYGLPVGGNLEYADKVTLSRSLANRDEM